MADDPIPNTGSSLAAGSANPVPAPVAPSPAPAAIPNTGSTQDATMAQVQPLEQKAQTAYQRASDLTNAPIVQPTGPHARLAGMVQGLMVGLSALGESMGTHGEKGGAAEVAQIQGEQQRQKLESQQFALNQRNQQIQQQITLGDTAHKMGQNIILMAQMPDLISQEHLKVTGEQQQQAGEAQRQAGVAQNMQIQLADFQKQNFGFTPAEITGAQSSKPGQPGAAVDPAHIQQAQTMLGRIVGDPNDPNTTGAVAILGADNPAVKAALDVVQSPGTGTDAVKKFQAAGNGLDLALQQHGQLLGARKTEAETTASEEPARYMRIQSDQTLGKPVSAEDKAWAAAYEKKTTLGQRYMIQATGNLAPGALDDLATAYHTTGQLPQTGFGPAGTAMRTAIINHSHEMFGNQTLATSSAEYKANENSLKNLQKTYDQVNAFESTAGKNLGLFLNQAQKIVDTGSPWVNQPLRSVQRSGLGLADQTAFDTARQVAVNEIGRVLNTSSGAGVVSDSARQEVSTLMRPDATLAQITRAAGILTQDMKNRQEAYQQQIADIQGRLGGQPTATPGSASATQPPVTPTGAIGKAKAADGKWYYHDAQGNNLGLAQ